MRILKDVLTELFSMFVSDARMTAAILAVVLIAAALIGATGLPHIAGGIFLLLGCIAVLFLSVHREAASRKSTESRATEGT